MSNRLPELGDRVKDKVTGFEGIAITHAVHLTGCDRLWIEPTVDKDGKRVEGMWCDIDMLEIVQPNVVKRVTYAKSAPGGVDLPRSR